MNRNDLRQVLDILKERGILTGPIRPSGAEHFGFRCLFAKWRHSNQRDRKPSMTAKIADSGATILKCHTGGCSYRKSLADALTELNVLYMGAITDLADWVRNNDGQIVFEFRESAPEPKVLNYSDQLREYFNNPFPAEALEFLKKKGCSEEITRKMLCCWIPEAHLEDSEGRPYTVRDAILFPVLQYHMGDLICVGAQAREIRRPAWKRKYFTFFSFTSSHYLYGEHLLHKVRDKRLNIVEGPLDVNHLLEIGDEQNEITNAVMGVFMGRPKIEKIKRAGPRRVAIFVDPDSPGRLAAVQMEKDLIREGVDTTVIDLDKDPKQLTREDLKNIWM